MKIKSIISLLCAVACGGVLCGCIANKASHQNGVVAYVSTSGQFGIGYGETEDMPGGCRYSKTSDIYTVTGESWLFGAATNHTHTVVEWDTTAMMTNTCHCADYPHEQ